jgi:hypothetical protein
LSGTPFTRGIREQGQILRNGPIDLDHIPHGPGRDLEFIGLLDIIPVIFPDAVEELLRAGLETGNPFHDFALAAQYSTEPTKDDAPGQNIFGIVDIPVSREYFTRNLGSRIS